MSTISKNHIIIDIRRIARLLQHSPSSVEYRRLGRFHIRTVQKKFGVSWQRIVELAGLRYTPRTSSRIPTDQEVRADVFRVVRELNHPPTRREYEASGRFAAETVRRRSGQKRWEDAVASFAGVDREVIKSHQRRGGCYRTTAEWLSRLRELSQKLGHAPTTAEANKSGINANNLRQRVGGNWVTVLNAAGIDLRKRSRQAIALSIETEKFLEDVAKVARRLGRPPTMRDYQKHGCYPSTTARVRLGGWRHVKKTVNERLLDHKSTEFSLGPGFNLRISDGGSEMRDNS
ncbi:MAG TPA: hypothetical protein VIT88_02815 [Pyrinomonadaceae bacterium]